MDQDKKPERIEIAWLPGDGIGPEVSEAALRVMRAATAVDGIEIIAEEHPVGGAALDEAGVPLPETTGQACRVADAVLLGAVGGPAWDAVDADRRPEQGLLQLRKLLSSFANLRPVAVPEALTGASPLRAERIAGVDMLVVRELTGGIYFGEPQGVDDEEGFDTMRYRREEVERIARIAFEKARHRRGRVTSVDKANVLKTSRLWREVVTRVHAEEFSDVELNHLYVDNAAMQLVRDPKQFDVILTGNLFGDILSDLGAALPGSLGLLPSASIGGDIGLFEPVHGSAPDIAGKDLANPIATILSGAMLLEEQGARAAAEAIRDGVAEVLEAGYRTADLQQEGSEPVGTREMSRLIAEAAERLREPALAD